MNKYKKLLLILLVFLGGVTAFFYFRRNFQTNISPTPEATQILKTTISVDDKPFDVSQYIGKTALEATEANMTIKKSGSGENAFVTSINGRAADSKKHEFWELVINGQPAHVGAGSYIIQNGDIILWRLSNY